MPVCDLNGRRKSLSVAFAWIAFGWATASCAQTAPVRSGAAGEQQVLEPGEILVSSSRVYIHVGKTGLGHEHAVIGEIKSGWLSIAGEGGGRLLFDMASLTADTDEARKYLRLEGTTDAKTQRQVTANMQSKAVLNIGEFPAAELVVKRVRKLEKPSAQGLPQYQLSGDFTLRGSTHPVQIVAAADEKDGWIHLQGSFSLLQTQFGITPYKAALGAVGVADRLDIWGDLLIAAERKVVERTAKGDSTAARQK